MIKEILDPNIKKDGILMEIKDILTSINKKREACLKLRRRVFTSLRYSYYITENWHWYSCSDKVYKIGINYPNELFCFDNNYLPLCRQIAEIFEKATKRVIIMKGVKVR